MALVLLVACGAGAPSPPDPLAEGQRLFAIWCSGCHTLAVDGPTALGPSLAGVANTAAANPAGLSAEEWLRREIVEPNAVLTPGYQPNLMPTSYSQSLRPEQIDALVRFMLSLE